MKVLNTVSSSLEILRNSQTCGLCKRKTFDNGVIGLIDVSHIYIICIYLYLTFANCSFEQLSVRLTEYIIEPNNSFETFQ